MKKLIIAAFALLPFTSSFAQDDVYPAKEYKGLLFIKNGTVHVGNGQVLENATIKISNGKIEQIGTNIPIPVDDVKVFDATGKHVYPGLILTNSNLGLVEVNSIRASSDAEEIGDYNAGIRSIVAYNTDSKVINTLKQTGVLLANVVPQGGIISGTSSIVQLDAWNWEDAAYVMDNAVHYNMPDLFARPNRFGGFFGPQAPQGDPVKQGLEEIEQTKAFLKEARAYALSADRKETNLKFEALKGLFDKSKKFFIHADIVKQMLMAIDFKKELGLDVVIVGGSESFQIAELLKQNDIPVIVNQMHSLPTMTEDAVDLPYKLPALLQQAGVLYAINDEDGQHRGKNLPFNAGTAAAYGLTKEQALQAITLNAAKILGIANRTGSIEVGKDANIVISTGDILDMRSNNITHAFIQGRHLSLDDKHKQLYERYKYKYDIK
ncbi:MAG: amidohydrolase family protein [Chitinophagaceae bacterium]